jgi:non-specific serine/threonine protein kinase
VLAQAGWIALCLGDEVNAEDLVRRCGVLARKVPGGEETVLARAAYTYVTAAAKLFVHGDPSALALWTIACDDLAAVNDARVLPMAETLRAIAAAFVAPEQDAFAITDRHLNNVRAHGATWTISWAEWARAVAELRHGDPMSAVTMFRSALRVQWDIGDHWGSVWAIESLAWGAVARDQHEQAALLLGAARSMQETIGVSINRLRPWADAHADCVTRARRALGEAYEVTEGYGASMEQSAAVDLALGQLSAPRVDTLAQQRTAKWLLSDKQRAVAELIARGKTDKQIASVLFLSPRTVQSHVSAILRKLGFTSRTEVAAWVVEQQTGTASRS